MLKNITVLKYSGSPRFLDNWETLQRAEFVPCTPSQQSSVGFVAPRGEAHGLLRETYNDVYVLKICMEEKTIPADVVQRKLSEVCDGIEKESGRRPGRKYQRELKEQVILNLLPQAFPRQKMVDVWFDFKHRLIFVGTTSKKQLGEVATLLVRTFDELALSELNTKESPAFSMARWILEDAPVLFTVDMDCKLKSDNNRKSSLTYTRTPLDGEEVHNYVEQGMRPVQLALTWKDRVSFILTENFAIKRIEFLDLVFASAGTDEWGDLFDTDITIGSGELLPLVQDLIEALGGVQDGN